MPSCNTYHLTWVSLTLGVGVSLHGCSSKVQPLLLTLDEGYFLTAALPDFQRGIAPLGPLVPAQPWLLGRGVGPPGHRPWPWARGCSSLPPPPASGVGAWGSSSCPPPLASGLGVGHLLPAAAPDFGRGVTPLVAAPDLGPWVSPLGRHPPPPGLGCGVAPLSRSCTVTVWYSQLLPLTSEVG